LTDKGISNSIINKIGSIIGVIDKSNREKVEFLHSILLGSPVGLEGISELTQLLDLLGTIKISSDVIFDMTLARGLNYYTGAIIEVISKEINIGSVCGGGRYDNLAGVFGMEGVSGVGVSFGADRIYDVLSAMNKFDSLTNVGNRVLIVNFGADELKYNLSVLEKLHKSGISAEIYPDYAKMKKQLAYADSKKIPFVILAGEDEIKNNEITLKNMQTGEQKKINIDKLGSIFE
jgi:histidyl-tRNA synthetase